MKDTSFGPLWQLHLMYFVLKPNIPTHIQHPVTSRPVRYPSFLSNNNYNFYCVHELIKITHFKRNPQTKTGTPQGQKIVLSLNTDSFTVTVKSNFKRPLLIFGDNAEA